MPRAAYGYRLKMDSDHARELLARERARIEHALADLRQEMAGEEEQDPFEPSDVGRDLFDKELGEGLAKRLREELEAVERADRRLAKGTYGLSVDSGKPIPDARLETIPWAERTAEEQARYERERRLGL
jgi:RNA polymerase-binding transcription factor